MAKQVYNFFNFSKIINIFFCPVTFMSLLKWRYIYTIYEGVCRSFRTELMTKYTLTTINTSSEATQRIIAAKLNSLTHKTAIQLRLMAESCTICSSRSRRPARKLLAIPLYTRKETSVWYERYKSVPFSGFSAFHK
jgi:hypothetical protein